MSYYMGDFYRPRGDYYRGDPGIGSFLSGLLGKVPVIGSVLGPVGQIASKLLGRSGPQSIVSRVASPAAAAITAAAKSTAAMVVKHPVLSAAGAAGALAGTAAISERMGVGAGITGMKGHHISRKTGRVVRNRHMNFANPRALRRATRRLHSFARHYRKVVGFVAPRKPKGRMYFKARRRKAA